MTKILLGKKYVPPFSDFSFDDRFDILSFGIILYEILIEIKKLKIKIPSIASQQQQLQEDEEILSQHLSQISLSQVYV